MSLARPGVLLAEELPGMVGIITCTHAVQRAVHKIFPKLLCAGQTA